MLIVEDDAFKLDSVLAFLQENYESVNSVASSVNSAKQFINKEDYDIIILDMSLSNYDVNAHERGGRPQNFGGKEVMRYIRRKNKAPKVIVLTMYEAFSDGENFKSFNQLNDELKEDFSDVYSGMIHFDTANMWKNKLSNSLNDFLGIKKC